MVRIFDAIDAVFDVALPVAMLAAVGVVGWFCWQWLSLLGPGL